MKEFKKELSSLINRYSLENGSNTPDFILAEYLVNCLKTYNKAVQTSKPNEFKTKIISLSKPKELDWAEVEATIRLGKADYAVSVVKEYLTQQRTELLEEIQNMPIEVVGNSQATVNQIIKIIKKL